MLKNFAVHPNRRLAGYPKHMRNYLKLFKQWKYTKKYYELSRGEICVANFIPPANGTSQGNYFLPKSHKLAVLEEKNKKQL